MTTTASIHHGYLRELAETRERETPHERRRESWAEVRAEIDAMLVLLQPQTEREYLAILRAYKIGLGRGGQMMPIGEPV